MAIRLRLVLPLIALLCALAAPAWASAAEFTVNVTGDAAKGEPGVSCAVALGECTLRAAIEGADESAVGIDTINFDPAVFNGEPGDTISPAPLPEITTPTTIDGADCDAGTAVACVDSSNSAGQAVFVFKADESKLQDLSLSVGAEVVGIRVSRPGSANPGVSLIDNRIAMTSTTSPATGIQVLGPGTLIEGNTITAGFAFNFPIVLRSGPNLILGNKLFGSGCCAAGITLEFSVSGNQIGGDTAASENVIQDFLGGIKMEGAGATQNEVRRNRGANFQNFIVGATLAAPVITTALQSSASGTAEPGATVRVFRQQNQSAGEIDGFLGEATADGSGNWKVTFAKEPTGTFAAATATLAGSTSSLGESATLAEEPETGGGGGGGGGDNGGGGGDGGGTGSGSGGGGSPSSGSNATPIAAPAPVAPRVKITAGPKKSSAATTAKFRFRAEPTAGARFECRLDKAKWARCSSPRTYKKLKVGKHTFRVRATASGLTGAATVFKFTIKE
ncbi:MAG: hypothetical protein BGO11_00070 [Solirubrobacterales bacterium 70-9]|nr:MAG: hypothetical protein BGO11_00070 [Solirubrobacterales bacterium 70-9]